MKAFLDADFLLENETAKTLYHQYAAKMPIIDYHCHVIPAEIAENRKFDNLAQAWLGGDHYKWRLMRANGVDEKYITGDASDYDKFFAFASTMPKAIGNPVYHWCHLELQRYFDCALPINAKNAPAIWDACNKKLQEDGMRVRGLITQSNVDTVVTTDDPVDDLMYHKQIQEEGLSFRVLPGFRPDKVLNLELEQFPKYIQSLSAAAGVTISSIKDLYKALENRIDFFAALGCRASDHGVGRIACVKLPETQLSAILQKRLNGEEVTEEEGDAFRYAVLLFLGTQYAKRDWVMEIHFCALRNTNTVMFEKLGPDTGFDTMKNADCMTGLPNLMDDLSKQSALPKMVLFSLNPNDNAALASLTGCFQNGAAGKIQHGAAWWFNDTKTGMEAQMVNLANMSLLGNFIGMLTDSRSFLSYTRHEYFRRILCNLFGKWVENGEYPADMDSLQEMVQGISYGNAKTYLHL